MGKNKQTPAIREAVCYSCKHYAGGHSCMAFMFTGIPEDIRSGENLHKKVHPLQEDNSLVYEPTTAGLKNPEFDEASVT